MQKNRNTKANRSILTNANPLTTVVKSVRRIIAGISPSEGLVPSNENKCVFSVTRPFWSYSINTTIAKIFDLNLCRLFYTRK